MYKVEYLSFKDVPQFSDRDKAFQSLDERLISFITHIPVMDNINDVAQARKEFPVDRELLVEVLREQYASIPTSDLVRSNIESLKEESTFTVITAHQPSLLTGPLYFIYKIASAIKMASMISSSHKDITVVPVFITGGEDHDFDEIATMHMFGQDFTWKTDQIGATGRMNLDGLDEVIAQVKEKLGGGEHALELRAMIDRSLDAAVNYGDFMVRLTDEIFKDYGLVVANMDHLKFKQVLLPYVERDIAHKESQALVQQDQNALESVGFKGQAHAREINIFIHDKDRHRVIPIDSDTFRIGEDIYTKTALLDHLRSSPNNISPNVILRPVYQEIIFPNLAYIGGGGELAYWIERKSLFEAWGIPFPMLIRRDSMHIIDKKTSTMMKEVDMDLSTLYDREDRVIEYYTRAMADGEINLNSEKEQLKELFERIADRIGIIDPTLKKTALGESAKSLKSLDYLEAKMLKAEKNRHEIKLNRLRKSKQKLFPGNNSLQERYDNFMPFYLKYGQAWISTIIDAADPMDKRMKVLIEE